MTAGIGANGCYTNYCIPTAECAAPACSTLTSESACTARMDCDTVYTGTNCTCGCEPLQCARPKHFCAASSTFPAQPDDPLTRFSIGRTLRAMELHGSSRWFWLCVAPRRIGWRETTTTAPTRAAAARGPHLRRSDATGRCRRSFCGVTFSPGPSLVYPNSGAVIPHDVGLIDVQGASPSPGPGSIACDSRSMMAMSCEGTCPQATWLPDDSDWTWSSWGARPGTPPRYPLLARSSGGQVACQLSRGLTPLLVPSDVPRPAHCSAFATTGDQITGSGVLDRLPRSAL